VNKNITKAGRGVESFLERHGKNVTGVISGFDRLRLQGTLRTLYQPEGMAGYLQRVGVRWKDFKSFVCTTTEQIRECGQLWAKAHEIPCLYLRSSSIRKEELAREIIREKKITHGPVALMSAVEPCRTWVARGNRETKELELKFQEGKCVHLYFYLLDPEKGLLHLRLQTWFPFLVQVCLNGREWLGCQLRKLGIGFKKSRNCFTAIEDIAAAQELLNEQVFINWSQWLDRLLAQCHKMHQQVVGHLGINYYWSVAQSEYATDFMFKNAASLAPLYQRLIRYGIVHFSSQNVLRFLGRAHLENYQGEVTSQMRERPEGVRIKHCRDANSIKIYDKEGRVLRVETTINEPKAFRVYRSKEGEPRGKKTWRILRKSVADMPRRVEVSRAANERYLQSLASVSKDQTFGEVIVPLCQAKIQEQRRRRPLRPFESNELKLLTTINQGEFALQGFRNRDLRQLLHEPTADKQLQSKQSAAITRKLALLKAHGLIRKVPGTHRYLLTTKGRKAISAIIAAKEANIEELFKIAA
jgi:hypothetical protein